MRDGQEQFIAGWPMQRSPHVNKMFVPAILPVEWANMVAVRSEHTFQGTVQALSVMLRIYMLLS